MVTIRILPDIIGALVTLLCVPVLVWALWREGKR